MERLVSDHCSDSRSSRAAGPCARLRFSLLFNRVIFARLPAVSPASRRIFLYWLLLLIPTLVVGSAAILLLRREQARLAERSAETLEARRATTAARARLTVETIELLVGDVENGLLDTLAAEPADGLDAFLDRWEKENPLVRTTFRSRADGSILRPDPRTASEEGRGFLRRFPRLFGGTLPWTIASPAPGRFFTDAAAKRQQAEPEARKEVALNVAQAQSARRDVQELVKAPSYSNSALASTQAGASPSAPAAGASYLEDRVLRAKALEEKKAETNRLAKSDAQTIRREQAAAGFAEGQKLAAVAAPAAVRAKDTALDRRGWVPAAIDGRLHLAGWVQPGGSGEVRGVELEMAALISRFGGALPAGAGAGEGYALRDDQGRVMHQVGAVPRDAAPAARVPLAASLLPGWDVAGYLAVDSGETASGASFFWVNALLVGIFVVAILSGGSLLLWQARRSEAEAAQKTSFVANVSHEFKTPLTTIRLYSELLEQGRVRDAAQGTGYLRTIGRETQRLARLVNNALDFSRLEQGKKKFAREPLDLTAELGRLLDTHAPRMTEAGLALTRRLPTAALPATTDRDAVEQIVINLLDNACKYAGSGGEITVSLEPRAAGGAEVRVADRGPGVPAEHREKIFEKFHRVDDALTADKSGAGLGLSIARQLARGLGGELRYAPRPGGGAEFILQLP